MSDQVNAEDQKYVTDVLIKAGVVAQQVFKNEEPAVVFSIYELLLQRAHCRMAHNAPLCGECGEPIDD